MKRFVVSCALVLMVLAPGAVAEDVDGAVTEDVDGAVAEDTEKTGLGSLTISLEGLPFAEEGGSIRMTAPAGSLYDWKKDGVALGLNTQVLLLSPTVPLDTGNYWVVFEPAPNSKSVDAKMPVPSGVVRVQIFPAGTLPVGGIVGTGALIALGSFFGIAMLRKR